MTPILPVAPLENASAAPAVTRWVRREISRVFSLGLKQFTSHDRVHDAPHTELAVSCLFENLLDRWAVGKANRSPSRKSSVGAPDFVRSPPRS